MKLELSLGPSFSFFPLLALCSPFLALYSPSHCCSLLHLIILLFTLLLSSSHYLAFLFALLLFYFKYKFFCVATFLFVLLCFPLHIVVVGVLLFVEESCINLLNSSLQELRVVGTWELKTCIFFSKYFSLCLFPFYLFVYLMSFVPLFFFLFSFLAFSFWCKACYKLFWRQT